MSKREARSKITDHEAQGILAVKELNRKYLNSGKGSEPVLDYLTKAGEDDGLLLRFLRGRKHRPKHAWETIKRHAEVQFDKYPEAFPLTFPEDCLPLFENHVVGILKNRDSKGRIVTYFNASEWDTDKYPIDKLLIVSIFMVEYLLKDEDTLRNGVVYIQECSRMGMNHVKQYKLNEMLKYIDVFWFGFPMRFEGAYYINVPYVFSLISGIIKPFLPKKLKKRFLVSPIKRNFKDLHERLSPSILPKFLGGDLENHEAVDNNIIKTF